MAVVVGANLNGVSPTTNAVNPLSEFNVSISSIVSGYPGQAITLNSLCSSRIAVLEVIELCSAFTTTCLCAFLPMNGEPSSLLPDCVTQASFSVGRVG